MSMSQTAAAGGVIILALLGVSKAILPTAPPITVHSISLDPVTGIVTQDRTVTGRGEVLLMTWAAQAVDGETGIPLPGCTGAGTWPYQVGHRAFEMHLPDWIGNENCTVDDLTGTVILRAVYSSGTGPQVVAESAPVVVP